MVPRPPRQEGDAQVLDGMLGEVQAGRVAWMVGESTLSLTDFTILPDLRGRHLGVQLLGQAVKYARRQGRYALTLACSAELAGYFAQYGFEETGRRGDACGHGDGPALDRPGGALTGIPACGRLTII